MRSPRSASRVSRRERGCEPSVGLARRSTDDQGTHAYASYALLREYEKLEAVPDNLDVGPETRFSLGAGPPEQPFPPYASWPSTELRRQLAPDGPLQQRLGQQLIAYIYTAWEHEYRGRLARLYGVDKDDLKIPLLGDLRVLRHDVLHHQGIASKDNSGKCEVVRHWVDVGHPISIGAEQVYELWKLFPWAALVAQP